MAQLSSSPHRLLPTSNQTPACSHGARPARRPSIPPEPPTSPSPAAPNPEWPPPRPHVRRAHRSTQTLRWNAMAAGHQPAHCRPGQHRECSQGRRQRPRRFVLKMAAAGAPMVLLAFTPGRSPLPGLACRLSARRQADSPPHIVARGWTVFQVPSTSGQLGSLNPQPKVRLHPKWTLVSS